MCFIYITLVAGMSYKNYYNFAGHLPSEVGYNQCVYG